MVLRIIRAVPNLTGKAGLVTMPVASTRSGLATEVLNAANWPLEWMGENDLINACAH